MKQLLSKIAQSIWMKQPEPYQWKMSSTTVSQKNETTRNERFSVFFGFYDGADDLSTTNDQDFFLWIHSRNVMYYMHQKKNEPL
jgi:hypothetical protein